MVFGFAPGYVARTTIVGGTTSGYSLIGRRTIAISPTMKITIESTPAKIGRRMKKWEKFISFLWFAVVVIRPRWKAPSSKFQRSPKNRAPNGAPRGMAVWDLVLEVSLDFGAWDLELLHAAPLVFPVALYFNAWRFSAPAYWLPLPAV